MSGALSSFARAWDTDEPREAMDRAIAHLGTTRADTRPPYGLSPLVASLGAHIEYDALRHARLVLDERPRIVVPRGSPTTWRRQRFSVAHELAHLIVWQGVGRRNRAALQRPELHDELERLCNHGAAVMLMPTTRFAADLLAVGFCSAGLLELYDLYLVSWITLMIRISEVLEDAGVSGWAFGVRASDPDDLPRVVDAWGEKRTYIPPGISERSLSRAILSTARRDGHAWTRDLHLNFRREAPAVRAIAAPKPHPRDNQETLPFWEHLRVADEPAVITTGVPARRGSASLARRPTKPAETFMLLLSGDRVESTFCALAHQPGGI